MNLSLLVINNMGLGQEVGNPAILQWNACELIPAYQHRHTSQTATCVFTTLYILEKSKKKAWSSPHCLPACELWLANYCNSLLQQMCSELPNLDDISRSMQG